MDLPALSLLILEQPGRVARDGVAIHRGGRDVGDRLGGAQVRGQDPAVRLCQGEGLDRADPGLGGCE